MSELEQVKEEYHSKLIKLELIKNGFEEEEAEKYIKYVLIDGVEDIEERAKTIADDVRGKSTTQETDKTTWNLFE